MLKREGERSLNKLGLVVALYIVLHAAVKRNFDERRIGGTTRMLSSFFQLDCRVLSFLLGFGSMAMWLYVLRRCGYMRIPMNFNMRNKKKLISSPSIITIHD